MDARWFLVLAVFLSAHALAGKKPARPPTHDPDATRYLDAAPFGEVALYAPQGQAKGLALFASGDGGWNLGVLSMAREATKLGYWVAGFSTPALLKRLESDAAPCTDAAALFGDLGRIVAHDTGLSADTRPIVLGYSSGATLVYAALAQDGGRHLAGGVSLGFCPDLSIHKAFCEGSGLTQQWQQKAPFGVVFDKVETVEAPWRILQGENDQVCAPHFSSEYAQGQRDARAVRLPKVGHGFGVPRNWMPQYVETLQDVLRAGQ